MENFTVRIMYATTKYCIYVTFLSHFFQLRCLEEWNWKHSSLIVQLSWDYHQTTACLYIVGMKDCLKKANVHAYMLTAPALTFKRYRELPLTKYKWLFASILMYIG
jgi:hypothetical protein